MSARTRPAGVTDDQWEQYLVLKDMRDMGLVTNEATPPSGNYGQLPDTHASERSTRVSYMPKSREYMDQDAPHYVESQEQQTTTAFLQEQPSHSHTSFPSNVNSSIPPDYTATGDPPTDSAAFGSPFAHTAAWSPTAEDHAMFRLPDQSIKARIAQRFARTAGDVFNPPCPSFSRPVPQFMAGPFTDYSVPSKGKLVANGFKPHYPGAILAPRDISAADWARYLEDIEVAGRLTGIQGAVSNLAPLTMHLGATGYFVTKAIEKGMKKRKEPAVEEVMGVWQHYFFEPRGVNISVQTERMAHEPQSAMSDHQQNQAIDVQEQRVRDDTESDTSGSDSETSELDSDTSDHQKRKKDVKRMEKQEKKREKRERKKEKREEKRERKQEKRERKSAEKLDKKKKSSGLYLRISPL